MKILITGDSFAADWQIKYPEKKGWPNFLSDAHDITNLAQAGCSEYRILKQIQSANLADFDKIIIAHTSPFRLYVKKHPVHMHDTLHSSCDLIYSDIKNHSVNDKNLLSIVDYFENYFDNDYAVDIHNLICEKIDVLTRKHEPIHITGFEWTDMFEFENMINFNNLFKKHRGESNHLTAKGNMEIYHAICKRL